MSSFPSNLYVIKRDGRKENVKFDKITLRLTKLCYGLNMKFVDPTEITMKVVNGLYPGVTTVELDNLTAETAAYMTTKHPDYGLLAARIAVSNLHKETKSKFSEAMTDLYNYINPKNGRECPMIGEKYYKIIMKNAEKLDAAVRYERDYNFNYFGFKTLERSYLLKVNGKVAERPQQMFMRVSIGIHGEDIDDAIETYNLMSQKYFTHASPTLYNSATRQPQLSSCFLFCMEDDSVEGIFSTLKKTALISKAAGGVGLAISNVRATGSYIGGTGGVSGGLMPLIRVFNNTARYVDQGGNKRPGAFALYLEPWHADVFEFIDCRKNNGTEEQRARDIFLALWIPDLFMRRVEEGGDWTLMCPDECPGLDEVYGEEFEKLYEQYEREGRGKRTIKAQELWYAIVDAQNWTGVPFMLYKDSINRKSNQKNVGVIKCSNLCCEIVEYTSKDEVAVCNLASIALPMYVDTEKKTFDFDKLQEVVRVAVRNLNKIIEVNYYPVPETRTSNFRHRPIALGVQGLGDCFVMLRMPYGCEEAMKLNRDIFETMYYAAIKESCELSKKLGPYETFNGSPISQGLFQFDLWDVKPSDRHDWESLRADVMKYGVRNSLVMAPMPTASTAQILGNTESFEPYTSNVYSRRVLSGEFQIVNQHLLRDLADRGLWNDEMKQLIVINGGSIQKIPTIPDDLKLLYRTVWEVPQKTMIKMAADRGPFIDQTQSLNIYMAEPNYAKITSMHFYGWKLGLKTGMYYLRTKPAANPIQFSIDKTKVRAAQKKKSGDLNKENRSTTPNMAKLLVGGQNGKPSSDVDSSDDCTVDSADEHEHNMAGITCSLSNPESCPMCSC